MSNEPLTLTINEETALEKEKRLEQIVMTCLRKHRPALDAIADLLATAGADQQEAEILLLWMAGTSHGMRAEPVTGDLTMYALARGWQFAATKAAN